MKYKAGDRVRVKSKEWFDEQEKNGYMTVVNPAEYSYGFNWNMYQYCGQSATITHASCTGVYFLNIDEHRFCFEGWMLEDLTAEPVKKHTIQRRKFSKIGNLIY